MPSKPIAQQSPEKSNAPKPPQGELDIGALDKVTGGLKSTGLKSTKTADPCEGGE